MLRMTLFTSLLTASLFSAACIDDSTMTDDQAAEGDGKGDSWGLLSERKVLDEHREPSHAMQDAAYVYYFLFTEEDEANNPQTRSVMRVRRSTGMAEKIASIVGFVDHAALGGNFIYFSSYEGLYKLPKTGGEAQLVGAIQDIKSMAADASGVYVAIPAYENERYFHKVSKIATGTSTPVELARATWATSIAVDDTHVYWLDETQPNPAIGCGHNAGAAHKVSKLGGLDVTLQAGITCPLVVTVDNSGVYYTSWNLGSSAGNPVVKLPKLGGLPQLLGVTGGMSLVTDPSYVYWISTSGNLVRKSKAFGVPYAIARDVDYTVPGADAAGLYFWRDQDGEPRTYSMFRIGQ